MGRAMRRRRSCESAVRCQAYAQSNLSDHAVTKGTRDIAFGRGDSSVTPPIVPVVDIVILAKRPAVTATGLCGAPLRERRHLGSGRAFSRKQRAVGFENSESRARKKVVTSAIGTVRCSRSFLQQRKSRQGVPFRWDYVIFLTHSPVFSPGRRAFQSEPWSAFRPQSSWLLAARPPPARQHRPSLRRQRLRSRQRLPHQPLPQRPRWQHHPPPLSPRSPEPRLRRRNKN